MIRVEGRPAWWSMAVTRTALRVIPAGPVRERWQVELIAELYGLTPGEQARHTAGVVSRILALRTAAAHQPDPTVVVALRKPLRCSLGRHDWRINNAEDSGRYRRCRRCGKDDTSDAMGPDDWAPTLGGTV